MCLLVVVTQCQYAVYDKERLETNDFGEYDSPQQASEDILAGFSLLQKDLQRVCSRTKMRKEFD